MSLFNPASVASRSKSEAVIEGQRTYKGTPCLNAHEGIRYTSSGSCLACSRDRSYERNKGHFASRMVEIDHILEQRKDEYSYFED
jgi:hypothetical protein